MPQARKLKALCNQLRTVDLEARGAKRVERVGETVMEEALARVQALFDWPA